MKKTAILCILCLSLNACLEGKRSSEKNNNREFIPEHGVNRVIGTAETIALKNGSLNWKNVNEVQLLLMWIEVNDTSNALGFGNQKLKMSPCSQQPIPRFTIELQWTALL